MVNETQRRMADGETRKRIEECFGVKSALRKIMKIGFGVESLGQFKSTFTAEQELNIAARWI